METKKTKIKNLKKKLDRKPTGEKVKGLSFPVRTGKLGVVVTR